ncbi:protein STAY-GREEN homolog, chloroplastic-like [Nicotiana tomentosiformis]|uniref:protein STAY-GREEN homolog, chloroplastic-like n=1 Tax=Nicotiana tomentosiformis TaxID=4098 RepID=UPI0008782B71|nr:protein STAY-GREEN homolog, chloroplastic-like [Nicotiana tomentosiformis]XP_033513330.1 protein STAY-GREEN homolog, chloroplastic-like [Nicotiana tomentosiformis]
MRILTASLLVPSKLNPEKQSSIYFYRTRRRSKKSINNSIVTVARLLEPAIFEASKLTVLFSGVDEGNHPGKLPRTYTFTHCDLTSKLTLTISQTINNSQLQGWHNRLQRDEVVAEWKKVKGKMSLHVHCHISGSHFLLDLCARLRYYIFCKELPVVLKAFIHGDGNLLQNYPELQNAPVWIYFNSNIQEFNKIECLGPLKEAASSNEVHGPHKEKTLPEPCQESCKCCFPSRSLIHGPTSISDRGL